MLVILDTNMLLSALRAGHSPPARVVDAWRAARFRLATSREQIEEFRQAARYPKLRPFLRRTDDKALLAMQRVGVTRVVTAQRLAAILGV